MVDTDEMNYEIYKDKKQTAKTTLKKNKAGRLSLPDCKASYKATIVQRVQYWWTNRQTDGWKRRVSLEIDPRGYNQLFFDKSGKITQWR